MYLTKDWIAARKINKSCVWTEAVEISTSAAKREKEENIKNASVFYKKPIGGCEDIQ